ncbi:MAG TPA: sugar ABC transporter permease [Spirochaetia bacterium]|nr:sugar ABC transporter permease [Spirochaetia bacterium]
MKGSSSGAALGVAMRKPRRDFTGLVYIAPWVIGFAAFKVFPLLTSLYLSLTSYNIVSPPIFVGLRNFAQAFLGDSLFWQSAKVSGAYVLLTAPVRLVVALFVAYLLSSRVRGIAFFRAIYYIPSLMGGSVAIAILWRVVFQETGLINQVLAALHLPTPVWFAGSFSALFVISSLHVWQFGATMVIFLAALKNIPVSLIEAAVIDGARRRQIFMRVTIPYITPVIFFNLIINLVNAFQEFNTPYVVTQGGPKHATYLMSLMIYNNAFTYLKMGYSSALSWILFTAIAAITIILFKSSNAWVHYQE